MPLENIPWAVLGGKVSASVGRMLAYHATSKAEGIGDVGDMLVRQTSTASSSIRISAGGAVLKNRYPGVTNESYIVRAGDETVVAVPANNTGVTRYDMVIVRIDDWNFPGAQAVPASLPTDTVPVAKYQIVTNVSASVTKASQLGLNYPAIALALLTIPANTSTITTSMITSLREVAVPRRERRLLALGQSVGRDNSLIVGNASGERFPDDALWTIEVPDWATQVRVRGDWGGILAPAGASYGKIWLRLWDQTANVDNTQASLIDFTSGKADPSRVQGMTADTRPVPAAVRGTSQKVAMVGQRLGGTTNLKADAATALVVDMEFLEAPTEDV